MIRLIEIVNADDLERVETSEQDKLLRHGNKKVFQALKILTAELQRQKSKLIKGHMRDGAECECLCHRGDKVDLTSRANLVEYYPLCSMQTLAQL